MLETLGNAGVGEMDRRVVARAALGKTHGGAPTIALADDGAINALYRLAGRNPAKIGKYKNVAEHLRYEHGTDHFRVKIENRYLDVQPIQPVRANL